MTNIKSTLDKLEKPTAARSLRPANSKKASWASSVDLSRRQRQGRVTSRIGTRIVKRIGK